MLNKLVFNLGRVCGWFKWHFKKQPKPNPAVAQINAALELQRAKQNKRNKTARHDGTAN